MPKRRGGRTSLPSFSLFDAISTLGMPHEQREKATQVIKRRRKIIGKEKRGDIRQSVVLACSEWQSSSNEFHFLALSNGVLEDLGVEEYSCIVPQIPESR